MSSDSERLSKLLETFNIPDDKKGDVNWLKNNVDIRNTSHRDLAEVERLIKNILIQKADKRVEEGLKNKMARR